MSRGSSPQRGNRPTPSPSSTSSAGPVLRLALPDSSPGVDPAMVADDQGFQVASLLYSGLVALNSSYQVVPSSAASWTTSRDHRTYTFHLRHGLRFSNGDPVTAYDFAFSINRSLSPALKSLSAPTYLMDIQGAAAMLAGKAKAVRGVKVLDPYTIRITARWPVPYFLTELAYPTSFALDSRLLKKLGEVDAFSWYADPIGSGPYRLKSWEPNTTMTFVPNRYYRGPRPSLRQVRLSLAPLVTRGVYQYASRRLDVVTLCPIDRGARHKMGVQNVQMLSIYGIYMNLKWKQYRNAVVRRALTLALDRTSLVLRGMNGLATPFQGFVPAGEMGYDTRLRTLPYNPRAARALLTDAGYRHGTTDGQQSGTATFPAITLYYADDPCNPGVGKLAQAIVKAWHKNLGISADARALTNNTLLTEVQSDSLATYLAGWTAHLPDPHDSLSLQWESTALDNDVHFRDPTFDTLVAAADATWNPQRRLALYREAEQLLVDEAAWIPLYIPHQLVFLRPQVVNLAATGFGLLPRDGDWARVAVRP